MSLYGHLVICTPTQSATRKEGTPTEHFGRFNLLVAAEAHMRYLGQYIKHLVVWDVKLHETVAVLRQAELEYDPLAPPIEMYVRYEKDQTITWGRKTYDYHGAYRNARREGMDQSETQRENVD